MKHGFKFRPRIQTLATLLINLFDFRKASPNSTNLDVLICGVNVQTVVKIQHSRALGVPTPVLAITQVLYKDHFSFSLPTHQKTGVPPRVSP